MKSFTSGERIKLGGAENGHEFELSTMTEKSTKHEKKQVQINVQIQSKSVPISWRFRFSQ